MAAQVFENSLTLMLAALESPAPENARLALCPVYQTLFTGHVGGALHHSWQFNAIVGQGLSY